MQKHKSKLLLVGSLPPPATGPSVSFQRLCQSLKTEGIDFKVINLSKPAQQYRSKGQLARVWRLVAIYVSYVHILIMHKPSSIYLLLSSGRKGFIRDFFFLGAARLRGARVVCHLKSGRYDAYHRTKSLILRRLVRYVLSWSDVIIVLSPRLTYLFDFLPSEKTTVVSILNGNPGQELPFSGAGVEKDGPVQILYLSNLMASKGYWDLLSAAKLLSQQKTTSHNWNIILAGNAIPDTSEVSDTPEQIGAKVNAFITDNGLSDVVAWVGPVSGETKDNLLLEADIFVLPSNYASEGQPVSIIEALSTGTAILSTDYRAIPDMLKPGKNGAFIEYGNPGGLAAKLSELIYNEQMLSNYKNASRRLYVSDFTWDAHARNIVPIILGKA